MKRNAAQGLVRNNVDHRHWIDAYGIKCRLVVCGQAVHQELNGVGKHAIIVLSSYGVQRNSNMQKDSQLPNAQLAAHHGQYWFLSINGNRDR